MLKEVQFQTLQLFSQKKKIFKKFIRLYIVQSISQNCHLDKN